jgi:hypothetical protein
MIELLVTVALVAVGLVGLVASFDHSRDLVNLNEKLETATHHAELEAERILALPYNRIALKTAPTTATDPKDPNYYVSSGPPPRYQWDQGSTGPKTDDLVIDATNGVLDPVKLAWQDSENRLSGHITRYVTWTGDMCASCAGVQQAKRVTVAVTLDGPDAPRKPILISTIKVDPDTTG